MPNSLKWANLALHRYEGVSDSDLLELYVPLLKTGIQVWDQNDMSKDDLERDWLVFEARSYCAT